MDAPGTKRPCPHCSGTSLYVTRDVSAGGYRAPNYLPGLGGFWSTPKLDVVVCADCGLTRFFASSEARSKLPDSSWWRRL